MAKTKKLTMKGDEIGMTIVVTFEEVGGLLDAIEDSVDNAENEEDREFYAGLRKRWLRHEGDFARSLKKHREDSDV